MNSAVGVPLAGEPSAFRLHHHQHSAAPTAAKAGNDAAQSVKTGWGHESTHNRCAWAHSADRKQAHAGVAYTDSPMAFLGGMYFAQST